MPESNIILGVSNISFGLSPAARVVLNSVFLHECVEAGMNSAFWLMWYGITGLMARWSGEEHPPYEPGPLGLGRQLVAGLCLVLFVLLFLPTPLAVY